MNKLKQTTFSAIVILLTLSGLQVQAQSVPAALTEANSPIVFNDAAPPSTGQPGRRSDAGSRGCGEDESASTSEPKPLLALVPVQKTAQIASSTVVSGNTAAASPTFWFYLPHRSSFTATFVLQDQDGSPLYESDVVLPKTVGIVSLKLPATVAPLAVGKRYHWFFKLYCRSISPPDSFVDGWIQREALTFDLTQRLKTATLPQQVRLYAAYGFWFDALTTAAALRHTNASDSSWAELLKAIGLETVAAEAIATP